jgi:predicted NBD/HSP70 family sugar kinase
VAILALKKLSRYLGIGLANLYNAFDIPIYILGGEFGKAYEPFLGDVCDTMTGHLVQMPPSGIELRISRLQPDAALMGAVARVFDKILIEPSLRVAI